MRRDPRTREAGLNYVHAGSFGGTQTTVQTSLVFYCNSDIERDVQGLDHSAVMAHEIGHVLGLGEGYIPPVEGMPQQRTATDRLGRQWRTQSQAGFEGNIMGDIYQDRYNTVRELHHRRVTVHPGRLWVGWTQARDMVLSAYRCIDPHFAEFVPTSTMARFVEYHVRVNPRLSGRRTGTSGTW
jgi:hypothetical protein